LKKRKPSYPKPRTANRPAPAAGLTAEPAYTRSTVASINLRALEGRSDLSVGDLVRIGGGGLYAGQLATVGSLVAGLIPAAMVRTEAGKTRRVRAIDLERAMPVAAAPAIASAASQARDESVPDPE